ncbi:MAG: adhesin, partial [Lagierella massiliensis]|nr:adhesin [Lagierella massiliensis]
MKKQNKRQIGSLLFLLFCLLFNTQISFASEMPKLIHFTISYEDKGQKIQGAKFSIYKIGDVGEYNKVILNGDFKDYPVDIRSINRDEWNEYANTLKAYAKKDNVKATFEGTTDKNGIISAKLKKGLYLVVGQDLIRNGYRYKTNP